MLKFIPILSEQKQQFDDEGYLIVRNVLDADTIETLIEASDRLIDSDRRDNRQQSNGGLYDGFRNCISMDPAFVDLLMHPKTFPIVVQLLGPNINLLTSHLIYRHPDPEDTPLSRRLPGWHRDHYASMADLGHARILRHSLKIAYYLTDLSEPNSGATMVAPGTNQLKEPMHIPEGQPDPPNALEPLLQPGDCVIFENRTYHAGAANRVGRLRKAVMFGYAYQWIRPYDYRQQPPEVVEKLDAMGRYLIGEPVDDTKEFRFDLGPNPIKTWGEDNGYTYSAYQEGDRVFTARH